MQTLTFIVGSAADAFNGDFASAVDAELRGRYSFGPRSKEEPYRSEPVNARGWRDLQTLMRNMLGADAAPHFTTLDAYQTVYLPVDISGIDSVHVANAADPLHVTSLEALINELTSFASVAQLPTDELELMQLGADYLEDDIGNDRELDFQTYVQLMLSAKQAAARQQALWIVT